MLEFISSYSTVAIVVAAALHGVVFVGLIAWARHDRKRIAQTLQRFTDSLPHRSRMDFNVHLSDQIEAFLADIQDVLSEAPGSVNRRALRQRMQILDGRREYLQSMSFETVWNVARTMIEAYPLAGVLGTILAIGSAMATDQSASVAAIVARFGEAIWSTFAGLVAAISLMLVSSFVEPSFARLAENRTHVRETAAAAKRDLTMADETPAAGP